LLSGSGIQRAALDSEALTLVSDVRSMAVYVPSGHLLYARDGSLLAHQFDIGAGRLVGEPRVISDGLQYFVPTGGAAFSASATGAVVFRRNEAVPRRLTWIGRDGREQASVAPDAPWTFSPRLSRSARHIAVSQQSPTSGSTDLWVFDLVTGTPTKLSDDLFLDNWPTWWPDGRSIVVSRDTSSSEPHLYRRSIAGASEPVRLVPPRTPSGLQSEPDVLFDGQAVAFAERGDIWLWRLGAPDFEPLVQSQYSESSPAFSPDGRWVAYDSNSSGRREVYVLPFGRPGEPVRISDAGGFAPRWREDGRELFFLDPARQIMAVALATDKTPSRPPVRLTNGRRIEGFDVTPDGTRFVAVVSLPNPSPPSLTVVMNWPTLMK
jgi:dipeptidyl aminopeptidase/acylaminoacyl peptidase